MAMSSGSIHFRRARLADTPAIRDLHARSLRQLGCRHYPREVLEGAIAAGTFQPSLLHAGHYQVAVVDGRIIGCGGWLEGGASGHASVSMKAVRSFARQQPANIRAVYIDPAHARRGIGGQLMAAIEADAMDFGKSEAEVLATHMAIRFFVSLGYAMEGPLSLSLASGQLVEVFAMRKTLAIAPTSLMGAMLNRPASLERATAA